MPHVDLLELPYFEGISMDDLVSLVDLMAPRQLKAGTVVMQEGDPLPPPLYIATRGRVLISKKSNGDSERALAEFEAPTLFGEIELFCQIGPVATVRAISDVDAFALDLETFDRLFRERHAALMRFIFNVARVACHRLAIADEMMARVLASEDLVRLRRVVFSSMSLEGPWPQKTGFFKRKPPES
jgi:CRP-like cAMP-binding protein